jgi:hypothetical protein
MRLLKPYIGIRLQDHMENNPLLWRPSGFSLHPLFIHAENQSLPGNPTPGSKIGVCCRMI